MSLPLKFKNRLIFSKKICYKIHQRKKLFSQLNTNIMEKNIYLFRHGETDFNQENRWQGRTDNLLNAKGTSQAIELGKKLSTIRLDVIYSSPLLRAVQTANLVAQQQKKPTKIVILQDLREGDFGEVEGLLLSETEKLFGDKVQKFLNATKEDWDICFKGGESKKQIFERSISCLQEIVAYPGKNIGISCHGGIISALKCGLDLTLKGNHNCAVLELNYDSETNRFFQP